MSPPHVKPDILETAAALDIQLAPQGKEMVGRVPWRSDTNPSLQINREKQLWSDFPADESGDSYALIMRARDCEFGAAKAWAAERGLLTSDRGAKRNGAARIGARKPEARPQASQAAQPSWLWPDEAKARKEFERLPRVKDNDAAAEFFADGYGLSREFLPDSWRIFDHPSKGGGVVYPSGLEDEFGLKFKARERDEKGKRAVRRLFGEFNGTIVKTAQESRGIVVAGGEEKGVAANLADYDAFILPNGEAAPSDKACEAIKAHGGRVIIAFDADKPGVNATAKAREALRDAGISDSRVHWVVWPRGTPRGRDLNDEQKDGGVEAVAGVLKGAKGPPRVWGVNAFVAADDVPKPDFLIEGILTVCGQLVLSAAAKTCKTRLALQLAFALVCAPFIEFLGWRFEKRARVLYLRAEIADGFFQDWIMKDIETGPEWLDPRRLDEFRIVSLDDFRPVLDSDKSLAQVEAIIEEHKPDVVIFDPFRFLFPSMEENASDSMGAALDVISGLAHRHKFASILIHHSSKTGGYRGSSVLEGWPDSLIELAVCDKDEQFVKVSARCRHSVVSGPVFWKRPDEDDPWLRLADEDETARLGTRGGAKARRAPVDPKTVRSVLAQNDGPMCRGDLRERLKDKTGRGNNVCDEALRVAKERGLVSTTKDGTRVLYSAA